MNCFNIITNSRGVPYLQTSNIVVSEANVDLALGFHPIQSIGYLTVRISNPITDATTGTLPVRITLNRSTRDLTFADGTPVTAADLVGTTVIEVFNDSITGLLVLMSLPAAPTA